ncbi:MAG: hypothetical protein J3K34DRAFT_411687 [Monoraphidium minutum]|nr:MAG: hypothetical protein J3K34DRAFT_411687 [Monoraphidium minutum]
MPSRGPPATPAGRPALAGLVPLATGPLGNGAASIRSIATAPGPAAGPVRRSPRQARRQLSHDAAPAIHAGTRERAHERSNHPSATNLPARTGRVRARKQTRRRRPPWPSHGERARWRNMSRPGARSSNSCCRRLQAATTGPARERAAAAARRWRRQAQAWRRPLRSSCLPSQKTCSSTARSRRRSSRSRSCPAV